MKIAKRLFNAFMAIAIAVGLSSPALAVRTDLTAQNPPTILAGSPAADALDITWTAADSSNGNAVTLTGNEVVLAWNTHASTAYTVTVSTVADELGRTGDITAYSLAAGDIAWVGPIPSRGFAQTDGKLYLSANNAAVKFAVIKLRGSQQYK